MLQNHNLSMAGNSNTNKYETQLFYKAFLRPMEVCLKTVDDESNQEFAAQYIDSKKSLPYGLREVYKKTATQNKYKLHNFKKIPLLNVDTDYNYIKEKGWNNFISLIKGANEDQTTGEVAIKVAICVCMYNQSKMDLYRTISGISNNIRQFVENGIPAHQIVVCIIIDGIQAVDPSIQEIIEEFQKENGMYFSDPSAFAEVEQAMDLDGEHGGNMINGGQKALGKDFENYKAGRFAARREEYKKVKKMLTELQSLSKQKNLNFDSLDLMLEPFFLQVAKKKHRELYGWDKHEIENKPSSFYINKYGYNQHPCGGAIIREALGVAQRYFQEYILSRQKFALVNPFRVDVNQITDELSQKNKGDTTEELLNLVEDQPNLVPKMNLFFVTKYKNCGKLDSHNWFINGFCNQFNPQYSILLDVGLVPNKTALLKMVQQMEADSKIGGNCGFMGVKNQKVSSREQVDKHNLDWITNTCLMWVSIQRAQQFEYHFAHLVDKPFESFSKFIHVLPGAFSAYRMEALTKKQSPDQDPQLLKQYFHSINSDDSQVQLLEFTVCQTIMMVILPKIFCSKCCKSKLSGAEKNLYNSNIYLAEDRILCLGIHKNGYDLAYLPDAYANVDSMKTLHGLMGQRRRWINGSNFAFYKTMQELTGCGVSLLNMYLDFVNGLVFVSPALFLFTVFNAMNLLNEAFIVPLVSKQTNISGIILVLFPNLVNYIYVILFLGLIFFSLHLNHNNKYYQKLVYAASTAYGIISLISFGFLVYGIAQNQQVDFIQEKDDKLCYEFVSNLIKCLVVATIGLYGLVLLLYEFLYCRSNILVDILLSLFSLLFYLPTYLNIFNIYAICRIDDVSWGTKGKESEDNGPQNIQKMNWKKIKLIYVSKYVLYNCVLGFILLSVGSKGILWQMKMTLVIMGLLFLVVLVKVLFGIFYLFKYKFCSKRCKPKQIDLDNKLNDIFNKLYKSLHAQLRKKNQPNPRPQNNNTISFSALKSILVRMTRKN